MSQTHLAQPQSAFQRNQLYSQRSYSVPNVSTTLSTTLAPAPRSAFVSPPILTSTLPPFSFEAPQPHDSYSQVYSLSQSRSQYDSSPGSAYNELLLPHLTQEPGSMFDFSSQYSSQLSDVDSQSLGFYSDGSPSMAPSMQPYGSPERPVPGPHEQQLLESYEPVPGAFQPDPSLFTSHLLLDHPPPHMHQHQIQYVDADPYGVAQQQLAAHDRVEQIEQIVKLEHSPVPGPQVDHYAHPPAPAPIDTSFAHAHAHAHDELQCHSQSHSPVLQVPAEALLPTGEAPTQQPRWPVDLPEQQALPGSALPSPTVYPGAFDFYEWPQNA